MIKLVPKIGLATPDTLAAANAIKDTASFKGPANLVSPSKHTSTYW